MLWFFVDRERIIESILHKLVRKHMAGTTMDSAIDAAKSLGDRSIPTSLMFLSSASTDRSKAKYIATTYGELIRRIARSGLKSSVHLQLDQLGSGINKEMAIENLREIANIAERYGIFLWVEPGEDAKGLYRHLAKIGKIGVVAGEKDAEELAKLKFKNAKLMLKDFEEKEKHGGVKRIGELSRLFGRVCITYIPENLLSEIMKNKLKSDIEIEFGYGYSERKMGAAIKKGAKISVLVPFGKDWIRYAMNNVPEGYMRFVAGKLLKEEEEDAA
jgi:proline dehydrogenase